MEESKAEFIYWVLSSYNIFGSEFDQERADYLEIKKARVDISDRYLQLRKTYRFDVASRMSKVEWLMRQ